MNIYRTKYNIVLVGAGGTGSQLIPILTQLLNNLGHSTLTIVDGDKYEEKNLKNQKCLKKDIGSFKSEVLIDRYSRVYKDLNMTCVTNYIKKPSDVTKLFSGKYSTNILISCVDNNSTRKIFNEVFYNNDKGDIIYIDAGNGTEELFGQVIVGYRICTGFDKSNKPQYETKLEPVAKLYPEILEDKDDLDKVLSCTSLMQEQPQHLVTNVLSAVTIFTVLNNILSFNEISKHIHYFNASEEQIISRD